MKTARPSRIAVRAPNWLGDVILSLPALRDLKGAYPQARLQVIARPSVSLLYEAVPEVDGVLESTGVGHEGTLYRQGFDLAVLFTNSIGTALSAALGGVPERWGYSTEGRGFLLTRRARVPTSVRGRSQVNYYRAMLGAMGVPTSDTLDTSLSPPAAWLEAGRERTGPGRFFGVAPGAAKGPAKQWPPARFAAAADALSQSLEAHALLLGSSGDAGAALEVSRAMRSPHTNLCGQTDLRTLVGIMSGLEAVLANDSGAMHLGAALGRPTLGVFGPTNPDETRPVGPRASFVRGVAECSPCRHAVCPIDHRCMTSVDPARAVETLLREVRS